MSQLITVEFDDAIFESLRRRADQAGITPAEWVAERVASQLKAGQVPVESVEEGRRRFEALIGSVDLGAPTGTDNESIDRDLAEEYAATHENP